MFPTTPPTNDFLQVNSCGPVTAVVLQPAPNGSTVGVVHVVCLCGLMAMVAVMDWRFTKPYSADEIDALHEDDQAVELNARLKNRNNRIYWGCVVAIGIAGVLALIQIWFSDAVKSEAPWLLYAETLAFLAFGTAWFVKGRAMLGLGNARRAIHRTVTGQRRRPQTPVSTGL